MSVKKAYKHYWWTILIWLLCCMPLDSRGQQSPMIHYTMADGLPSNLVYDAYRDSKGFIWFSTDRGLARYNGIFFETFTMSDGLPDDDVFFCREDDSGRMWIATYNGKLCFFKDGRFYTEKNCGFLKAPSLAIYSYIFKETDGSITHSGKAGNVFINIHHDKLMIMDFAALSSRLGRILSIRKIADNRYLLQLKDRKVAVDPKGNILKTYPNRDNRLYYDYGGRPDIVLQGDDGRFYNTLEEPVSDWIFMFRTDLQYVKAVWGTKPDMIRRSNFLHKVCRDGNDLFICTIAGVIVNNYQDVICSSEATTGWCKDRNGDYWITTLGHEIYHVKDLTREYRRYDTLFRYDAIHPQCVNKQLYFGDKQYNLWYSFSNGQLKKRIIKVWGIENQLQDVRYEIYFKDSNSFFFNRLDRSAKTYYIGISTKDHVYSAERWITHFKAFYWDRAAAIGVNFSDIFRFDVDSLSGNPGRLHVSHLWSADKAAQARILCSAFDADRRSLWFCTTDSTYKLDGNRIAVQHNIGKPFRKFFWHGSFLIGYDADHLVTIYKREADGTVQLVRSFREPNVIWEKFYPITDDKVIVSTNNYYRVISFLPDDHIAINPLEDPFIPRNAEFIYGDDTYCNFLSNGGVTSIPFTGLFRRTASPRVFFIGLKAGNNSYTIRPAINISSKHASNISLRFVALSFDSKEIKYDYSIAGSKDKDNWTNITGNTINITSPGYGTYYIKLRAKGLSTEYSESALFQLTILRPFWLTWWFLSLMGLFCMAVLFFMIRAIVKVILKRRRTIYDLESKYHSAEYKTLNALMNPHFIFNSLSNIKGLVSKDDKKNAIKFLGSFSNVVRQNMQNLSKEMVSVQEEIELVAKYLELERLRFGGLVDYEVNIDPAVEVEEIFIPPLLIQPLAENAVKHGLLPKKSTEGMISVNVYEKGQSVFIEVVDNGVGLNNSDYSEHPGYESLGLSNIEKRLSYLRQSGKQQIFFSISSRADTPGTVAAIEIRQETIKE